LRDCALRDRLLEGRCALHLTRVMACAVLGSWLYRQDLLAIFERHDPQIPLFLYLPLHNVGDSPPPKKRTTAPVACLSYDLLFCTALVGACPMTSCFEVLPNPPHLPGDSGGFVVLRG
jgi:hypothetical protein